MINETIRTTILSRLPEFLHSEYPKFVELLDFYFQWLETDNNFTRVLLDYKRDLDIDSQSEAYIDDILSELGIKNLAGLQIPKHHLIHFLREHYLTRGSEESFKFLFKAFFNEDVTVGYPREKLATASSSIYDGKIHIYTTSVSKGSASYKYMIEDTNKHLSMIVRGLQSQTSCSVEYIRPFDLQGESFLDIVLLKENDFSPGEPVEISYADTFISESLLYVTNISVTNGGKEYLIGDIISARSTNEINSGTYMVDKVSSGSVDGVTISTAGSGYKVGEMIYADFVDRGTGFTAQISAVNVTGGITEIKVRNKGWNYRALPPISIDTESGAGAVVIPTSSSIGRIERVVCVNPHTTKVLNDTVTFQVKTGRGSGAQLAAVQIDSFQEIKKSRNHLSGVLGRNCIITDSFLFQQYSYEVSSTVPNNKHKHLSNSVHPAGYVRFNIYQMQSGDTYEINKLESFIRYIKKLIYKQQTPSPYTTTPETRWTKLFREGLSLLKARSLSINIIDENKFSDNCQVKPILMEYPVILACRDNRFVYEALDAEVNIVTV